MRSEQLRPTTNELPTTHALAACWCHLEERECAVLEAEHEASLMKDEVASPGGTTIAGLHALEKAGVRGGLIDAVLAAARRAEELGKK
jgi:pyrroline-5-carboxylate reductase